MMIIFGISYERSAPVNLMVCFHSRPALQLYFYKVGCKSRGGGGGGGGLRTKIKKRWEIFGSASTP